MFKVGQLIEGLADFDGIEPISKVSERGKEEWTKAWACSEAQQEALKGETGGRGSHRGHVHHSLRLDRDEGLQRRKVRAGVLGGLARVLREGAWEERREEKERGWGGSSLG